MTRIALSCCALVLALAAGCGGEDSGGALEETSAPAAADTQLVVENYTFPALTVEPAEVVELVNKDAENHTLTSDTGAFDVPAFSSARPGELTTPAEPGSYAYHCNNHPTMKGTLTVSA